MFCVRIKKFYQSIFCKTTVIFFQPTRWATSKTWTLTLKNVNSKKLDTERHEKDMGLKHLSDFRVIFYKDHAQFDSLFKKSLFTHIYNFKGKIYFKAAKLLARILSSVIAICFSSFKDHKNQILHFYSSNSVSTILIGWTNSFRTKCFECQVGGVLEKYAKFIEKYSC